MRAMHARDARMHAYTHALADLVGGLMRGNA
jgi:hypothetical protein